MPSIMQPWTTEIGLRHQGVLVSAMRGCDDAIRHDQSKMAQRLLRGAILIPHAGRNVRPAAYIVIEPNEELWFETMHKFSASWDHYPNHYVMHFIHAAEIIGYFGPAAEPVFAARWHKWYETACHILHVNPETPAQLSARLDADEETFKRLQESYYRKA